MLWAFLPVKLKGMKYLGIDYGTKRVGVAMSDEHARLAFPRMVMGNTKTFVDEIVAFIEKEHVEGIVLGESHDRNNIPNPIMKKIRVFADQLRARTSLPIFFVSEAYTSQEAKHIQGENAMHDASAAAIILQSFLDREHDRPL